jgi:CRP/FNR family cyclic AMP-dependent transcriptional regulator
MTPAPKGRYHSPHEPGMSANGPSATFARCDLFKDFSETGLAILASIAAERALPAGTPLFVEGMASDAFFVVKAGSFKVQMRRSDSGEEHQLGVLKIGAALGQLALLQTTGLRMVSAIAVEPSEVVEIRARDFHRLQAQKPQACLKLMMAVATQLGNALAENRDLLRNVALARK